MSKINLIKEIETVVKMTTSECDNVKLALCLDDLLSNYLIQSKDDDMNESDNVDYINMYISSLKLENYSIHTLTNYKYELIRFKDFIKKSLVKAKTMDVRAYISSYTHIKASTSVTKLDILSSFYRWLVREEEILKNPCDKISRPKTPKKVREGLSIIELEQVRNSCKDIRQRALIEVFYSTGCRLDELRKLNIDDVDWQSNSLIVHGKGNKERRVFLSEKASWYLRKYLKSRDDDCEALFASERIPIRRLTNSGIQYQIKKIAKLSGISKPLHPHIFRHTFAQLSLDSGMELADLQHLLGHEKADTTLRYGSVSDERKYGAFRKYHVQ